MVIEPSQARQIQNSFFDNVVIFKIQENFKQNFCLRRSRNVDCFYLKQAYARAIKHLIRDNRDFLYHFCQDEVNLIRVHNVMDVACDMIFEVFRRNRLECRYQRNGIAMFELGSDANVYGNRKGFSEFLNI